MTICSLWSTRCAAIALVCVGVVIEVAGVESPSFSNPTLAKARILAVPLWKSKHPSTADAINFDALSNMIAGSIQVANGEVVVNTSDWRTVAITRIGPDETCTLTLVGRKIVILAAHCLDEGKDPVTHPAKRPTVGPLFADPFAKPATVTFDVPYNMTCTLGDDYVAKEVSLSDAPRSSEDYALCELDHSVPASMQPETIDRADVPAIDSPLQILGYGCSKMVLTDKPPPDEYSVTRGDGKLRIGTEDIEARNISVFENESGSYLVTSAVGKQPVICPGDSGGPAMIELGGTRRLAAINSAFGRAPGATPEHPAFYSYFSPLQTPAFNAFMARWVAQKSGRFICGYNARIADNCRG